MSDAAKYPPEAILIGAQEEIWWSDTRTWALDPAEARRRVKPALDALKRSRLVEGEYYAFPEGEGPMERKVPGWLCVRDYTGPDYVEPKPARPETLPVGTVVRPGRDWGWRYSRNAGLTGVVVDVSNLPGWVSVSWYNGGEPRPWCYRYGFDEKYEVEPVSQPEAPPQAEPAKPPSETVRVLRAALARAERGEIADVVVVARWLRNFDVEPAIASAIVERDDIALGMERGASVFVARGLLHTAATYINDGGRDPMFMRIGDEQEDEA